MDTVQVNHLVALAVGGNRTALEDLLQMVEPFVFNLSLRMLGNVADAQDATQEILIRIMTHLSGFRRESSYTTWVYRIATNYLLNYKKGMFSQSRFSFAQYGNDIAAGTFANTKALLDGVEEKELAEELKLSCTNVMLQCLDAQSRCIFILGTMFRVDSRVAGDILELEPAAYRQKLHRARKKMAAFLSRYCGVSGSGFCSCRERVGYAITQERLHPHRPEYAGLKTCDKKELIACQKDMETLEDAAELFRELPAYQPTEQSKAYIRRLLQSAEMKKIQER